MQYITVIQYLGSHVFVCVCFVIPFFALFLCFFVSGSHYILKVYYKCDFLELGVIGGLTTSFHSLMLS